MPFAPNLTTEQDTEKDRDMKKVDIAARDHLADAAEYHIAKAERQIAAARQALASGNEDQALIELDQATSANAAAMKIIEGGIGIGETQARVAITAAFLRGLDPTEPCPGPSASQTHTGGEGA